MITCPNCNHQNPDGAVQCEACYTPLPNKIACPSCGSTIQSDASFCGQCGADLRTARVAPGATEPAAPVPVPPPPSELDLDNPALEEPALAELAPDGLAGSGSDPLPELVPPDPLVAFDPIAPPPPLPAEAAPQPVTPPPPLPTAAAPPSATSNTATPNPAVAQTPPPPIASPAPSIAAPPVPQTRLQRNTARLLHVQTDTVMELPDNVSPIRIGKPNDRVPPDIDVSGFPESEIVSRVHANIRVEGDIYYIEDVGSSNGTYVNNMPLPYGNRHRLRPGDRIALGKGDKVSFIFQFA
ncbi:MAG: FHA domain-containing protein [Cyanobacteria bacterium J06632_22]